MGGLLLVLAVAMGMATFIENDFGTNAAKSLVYNSWWFELVFLILGINLFGSLLKHKMWSVKHFAVTLFHAAFFIIIIGATITRHYGYEGVMHIREGDESDVIYSSDSFVKATVEDGNEKETKLQHVYFSSLSPDEVSLKFNNGIKIKSTAFVPNAILKPVETEGGKPYVTLVGASKMGRSEKSLTLGETISFSDITFGFEPEDTTGVDFRMYYKDGQIKYISDYPAVMMQMQSGKIDTFAAGEEHSFYSGVLYQIGDARVVLKSFMKSGTLLPQYQPGADNLPNAVVLNISKGDEEERLVVNGSSGELGKMFETRIGDATVSVSYGALPIQLPFTIHLNKFILDRYPGSHSPSSYASEVTLIDSEKGVNEDRRIFMNNILNYRGYRFYQSSYDTDEKGTILSVNRDWLGTILTYIGYFLMAMGMMLALIMPNTRFRSLIRKTVEISNKKKELLAVFLLLVSFGLKAQEANPPHQISRELARSFGEIWVQDNDGRIKPMNTLNNELSRKMVKHNSFRGLNSDQLILSIMVDKEYWQKFPTITVESDELKRILGVPGPKAAFIDFFTKEGRYILGQQVETAYRKKPSEQNKLEQELIKVDEQVNVFYMTQTGRFLKMFPNPKNTHAKWLTPEDFPKVGFETNDSIFVRNIFSLFTNAISTGFDDAGKEYVSSILKYQQKYASEILPSEKHKEIEIFYNQSNLFLMLMPILMILGSLWLIIQFITLLNPRWLLKWPNRVALVLYLICFGIYTLGLMMRWYISGHAPWSNGYESMLYIGWATTLAGVIFVKRNPIAGSVTALFTSIILLVAHLSWMNPEITNLVPVLKSYWLTIHVAIIVASYGFLGLGALLAFLNLIIIGFKNERNRKMLNLTVEELSAIAEMTMTVGLYLLTIGAFLGGVWANESWGRYWGWDPKETWSMVTVFVYAFIIHMRLIPGMKSRFTFNFWALIGFSSVIMTYLGVNYYLAGMHSYAKGDPVPIPTFVYYTVAIIAIVSIYALINERKMRKLGDEVTNDK